MSKPIDGGWWF
jgi:hypothetical protein